MTVDRAIRHACNARQDAIHQQHIARFGAEPYYGIGVGPCCYPMCSCDVAIDPAALAERVAEEV